MCDSDACQRKKRDKGALNAEVEIKRDFGSFHSSNVDELIRQSAVLTHPHLHRVTTMYSRVCMVQEFYKAPGFPFELPGFGQVPAFGLPMREAHFYLKVSPTSLQSRL